MSEPRQPPKATGPSVAPSAPSVNGSPVAGAATEAPAPAPPAAAPPATKPATAPTPPAAKRPTAATRSGAKRGTKAKAARRPARPPVAARSFRPRLLPITIFAVVLMLGARVGDLWRLAAHQPELPNIPTTLAQTTPAAPAPTAPAPASDKPATDKPAGDKPAGDAKPADALGPIGDQELLKHYADRRAELDKRTRELEMREALLSAAEKRIDEKVKEMEKARSEIQSMMKLGEEKRSAEVEALIGIYDKMKPKEAAAIFEQMDMPQLLAILPKMKDTKTALILAAMNPAKAKEVTAALLERKTAPGQPGSDAPPPASP